MKTREEYIANAFVNEGFTFKGIKFRPITARTLVLLERYKSPFYFGGDELRGLLDVLYVSSAETTAIRALTGVEDFEEQVLLFAETFSPQDLGDLGNMVSEMNKEVSAAVVEIKETGKPEKK